jgi:hypothetical protein
LELIASSHLILLGVDMAFSKEVGSNSRFSFVIASIDIMEMMSLSRAFFSLCDLLRMRISSS